MISLSQTANTNDISYDATTHGIALCDGLEAKGHVLADAVRTLRGELQMDTQKGLPYDETVWSSTRNISRWRLLAIRRLKQFDFVKEITAFNVKTVRMDGRTILDYTIEVTTDEGTTKIAYRG